MWTRAQKEVCPLGGGHLVLPLGPIKFFSFLFVALLALFLFAGSTITISL